MKNTTLSKQALLAEVNTLRRKLARLEKEKAGQGDEDRYRSLVQALPDAIFRMDRDGVYLDFVPAEGFEVLHPPEFFLGKAVHEIMPEDIAEKAMHCIQKALASQERQRFEYELSIDDELRSYEVRIVPEAKDSILAIVRDITDQRQAEAALRDSERRFRATFEKSGIGMTLCGLDQRYRQTNPAFQAMLGYTNDELRQLTFWDITHPDDIARERDLLKTIVGDAPLRFDKRYVHKNGEAIWVRLTVSFISDDDGVPRYGLGIVEDITEQKQAEAALRESEEKFSKAFRASPDSITLTRLQDGLILEVNEGFEALSGYRREEVLGKTTSALNFWQISDRTLLTGPLQREGKVRDLEVGLRMRSGRIRECLVSAEVIELQGEMCLVTITRDVTERKRAQERLEAFFSQSFDGCFFMMFDEPVWWDDTVDKEHVLDYAFTHQRVTQVNEAMLAQYGATADAFLGLTPQDFFTHDISYGRACWAELFDTGRLRLETDERKVDGTPMWIEGEYVCLYDKEGRIKGHFGIQREITDRKLAEQEREHLIHQLEAKNAELERFTYTVSHDLKSPLVTIKGFLGLLEKDAARGDVPRVRQDVEYIRKAADKMHQLLDELLELSRIGRLINPSETVSLTDLACDAAEQVAGRIAARGVDVVIEPAMPVAVGDRVRLLEVLQNLVENAVKYMGDQPAPRVEIGGQAVEGEAVCYVRDNGVGIEAQFHHKIFGLFERLDAESEGTGIGLALVKRIIELHQGRIWVESEGLGHGATFFFSLPLSKD